MNKAIAVSAIFALVAYHVLWSSIRIGGGNLCSVYVYVVSTVCKIITLKIFILYYIYRLVNGHVTSSNSRFDCHLDETKDTTYALLNLGAFKMLAHSVSNITVEKCNFKCVQQQPRSFRSTILLGSTVVSCRILYCEICRGRAVTSLFRDVTTAI